MAELIEHQLLTRFMADAVIDAPGWFADMVAIEVRNGTTARELNFNTVDVVAELEQGSAIIHDAVGPDEALHLELHQMMRLVGTYETLSTRITDRLRADFGSSRAPASVILAQIHDYDVERLAAAALICAAGEMGELRLAVRQSHIDWRDLLVTSGLENSDWRRHLDRLWS